MKPPTRAEAFGRRSAPRSNWLTPQQHECLRRMELLQRSRVVRPRERVGIIASALGIDETTVRVHLAKARAKGWF